MLCYNKDDYDKIQKFIKQIENEGLIEAPRYLKSSILSKCTKNNILSDVSIKNKNSIKEKFLYNFKIVIAMGISLFFLFSLDESQLEKMAQVNEQIEIKAEQYLNYPLDSQDTQFKIEFWNKFSQ